MKKLLLLGAGSRRDLQMIVPQRPGPYEITTVDIEPSHNPDVVFDLNYPFWPFAGDCFDRVDAYEVLEHLGKQGDVASFFSTFYEIWRILKPGGILVGSCPWYESQWAWGDPGHTRVFTPGSFVFLNQEEYALQVGKTAMSDYRSLWKGDLVTHMARRRVDPDGKPTDNLEFILEARKNAV